ncbi:GerAB/ArcD/ProY family transporter [Terribacillus sp. DMT04]|uniref:GerAB/ArcD/ProY family transporter n=1 Tax=Terribacillus sp. DMT04 TaxID=2850441 RepID=UPI001C2C4457|nr:GerAB/ArcD/ProY family transporter [Terribacillus sp. DMT04]QXE03177.1 spore germination protein [Terribacillus sp. DMT04]
MKLGTNQITTTQMIALLSSALIAVGIFTLPRNLALKVGTPDLWISTLIGGIFSYVTCLIIVSLCLRFQQLTFFQFNKLIVGKWLGTILSVAFIGYALMIGSFEIRSMGELTQFYLLEDTPIAVIMISMYWVAIYLLPSGINPIARIIELLTPPTICIFIIVILLGLKVFELDNLRPVLGLGITPVLKGLTPTFLTFSGTEFLLVFIAMMQKPKEAKKVALIGLAIPVSIYLLAIVIITGGLSIERMKHQKWPTFALIQEYEYTGVLFERFESLFLVVWLIQMFLTYVVCHYVAAKGVATLTRLSYKKASYMLLAVVYFICLIPSDLNQLEEMGTIIGWTSFAFSFLVPALLLLIAWMRRLKLDDEQKGST